MSKPTRDQATVAEASVPAGAEATVYIYFDEHDTPLYVGQTTRGRVRMHEHGSDKLWFQYQVGCSHQHCSLAEVDDLEIQTIKRYLPPFNTQHNPRWQERRASYLADRVAGRRTDHGRPGIDPDLDDQMTRWAVYHATRHPLSGMLYYIGEGVVDGLKKFNKNRYPRL